MTPKGATSRKKDYLRRKGPAWVERESDPDATGPKTSLIGAAAMDRLFRDGTPAFFLHVSPANNSE